jgi:hypothetical protein
MTTNIFEIKETTRYTVVNGHTFVINGRYTAQVLENGIVRHYACEYSKDATIADCKNWIRSFGN